MEINDEELDLLLASLEARHDLSVAELDGVTHALAFLLGDRFDAEHGKPEHLSDTEMVIHIASAAFENGTISIHGRANDRDGHWRCTLSKDETADGDGHTGIGRSPVLSQAILSAILRISMADQKSGAAD